MSLEMAKIIKIATIARPIHVAVWTIAAIIGIAGPVVETGSDPTRIPIGAFFGPVAAAMLTALAGVVANVFRRGPPDRS